MKKIIKGDLMEWTDYIVFAAKHSKNNARHWFRYLRKYIDKCGVLFSKEQVDELYDNENLHLFNEYQLGLHLKTDRKRGKHYQFESKKVCDAITWLQRYGRCRCVL